MLSEKVVPGANHPPSTTTAFSRSSVVRVIELDRLLWNDLTLATEPINDRYLRIPAVHRAVFERPPGQARD